jgi:peptidoglycan-N-acetylglucosamine deacetylase
LLDRYEIKATFFVPGWIAEQHPDMVAAIDKAGHEIGHHGYLHEWPDRIGSQEREEEVLLHGIQVLEGMIGKRPLGYRAPGWEFSQYTLGLLAKHQFRFSSNMMDAESPYQHHIDGAPIQLVELPVQWLIDDSAYALFSLQLPSGKQRSNSELYEIWTEEFDGLYEEGGCFVLTMHPQIIGRPSRMKMLERVIQHMKDLPGVVFQRCIDTADEYLSSVERIGGK